MLSENIYITKITANYGTLYNYIKMLISINKILVTNIDRVSRLY